MSDTVSKNSPAVSQPPAQKTTPVEDERQGVAQSITDLLESLTDAFVSVNDQWRYTYVNRQAEKMLGKSREELLGNTAWNVFPAPADSLFVLHAHQAMDEQTSLEYTEFSPSLNKWFAVRLYPSRHSLCALFQDVTERKHAEEDLLSAFMQEVTERKHAEEQLLFHASLAQSLSDAVIATDTQYHILWWNDAAETLYGWKSEEVVGKYAGEVVVTDFPYNSRNEWREQLLTTGSWKGEVLQKRKDGTVLTILSAVSTVKDSTGTILGAVTVNHDITDRKHMEEQIWKSERQS